MRTTLLTAALTLVAFAPAASLAQGAKSAKQLRDASREVEDTSGPDAENEAEAAESENAPTTVSPSGKSEAPGSEHRVEKGDTLWDLSQRFLGNPWYWPKVWSYNPDIANPHWIYPGNSVRFFNDGDGPSRVEVGAEPTQLPDVDEGEMVDEGGDRVHVDGHIGYVPKKAITLSGTSFITTREIEETGSIIGSFFEAEMMAERQPIYVSYIDKRMPKVGEQFVIYRHAGEVVHPVTNAFIGYQTRILGQGRITKVAKNGVGTGVIMRAFDVIERGALIGPSNEPLSHSVSLRPNDRSIEEAYVVTPVWNFLTVLSEHQLIIIDKGADDGVKPGNTFTIWRQHDALSQATFLNPTRRDEDLPREDVGVCMAFEVKSAATTCLLLETIREIVRGDHVEMRSATENARSER